MHPAIETDILPAADRYLSAGLAVVPIQTGQKGPNTKGWNRPENAITEPGQLHRLKSTDNIGLAHLSCSPVTAAIDIDDLAGTRDWFAERDIDIDEYRNADDAVRVVSGRENRDKLLYRVPVALASKSVKANDGRLLFECRCAAKNGLTMQDVLPPSIHPDTGLPYRWDGDFTKIPMIPGPLLDLWTELVDVVPDPAVKVQLQNSGTGVFDLNRPEGRFNAANNSREAIIGMLLNAGYHYDPTSRTPRGEDFRKLIAPTSTTSNPGVSVFIGDDDKVRMYSHHESDPLNGCHDAWDVFLYTQHGGDKAAAYADSDRRYPPEPFDVDLSEAAEMNNQDASNATRHMLRDNPNIDWDTMINPSDLWERVAAREAAEREELKKFVQEFGESTLAPEEVVKLYTILEVQQVSGGGSDVSMHIIAGKEQAVRDASFALAKREFAEDKERQRIREACRRVRTDEQDVVTEQIGKISFINPALSRIREVEWLWQNMLEKNALNVIGGQAGVGKTTIAFKLAATLSSGGELPGHDEPCTPGKVLIYSSEDDPTTSIIPKLIAMGANLDNIRIVESVQDDQGKRLPFNPAKHMEYLLDAMQDCRPQLLIIDNIADAVLKNKSGNKGQDDVREALIPLQQAMRELGCTAVCISHATKGTQGKPLIERIIGSQAYAAVARGTLFCAKNIHSTESDFVIVQAKVNNAKEGDVGYFGRIVTGMAVDQYRNEAYPGIVKFGDPVTEPAQDIVDKFDGLVSPNGGPAKEKKLNATDWLAAYMLDKEEPVWSAEAEKAAIAGGIKPTALYNARKDLGIDSIQKGKRHWWWWRDEWPPGFRKEGEA